jgi:hypothetical protein
LAFTFDFFTLFGMDKSSWAWWVTPSGPGVIPLWLAAIFTFRRG